MTTTTQIEMNVGEAIYQRRSVRRYRAQPVEPAMVEQLLQAAVQAPSAMNQQPWAFAVFHGREQLRSLAERAKRFLLETYPATFELHSRTELYADPNYDPFHGADTLIVIYARSGRLHPNEDCCLAAENLMLAACGMGLGTCPIGFVRPWFDSAETKRDLAVPEHYTAVFPVVVGFPEGTTEPTPRDEPLIVSWRWEA